ncbi:unannotated protein [freshwater metagenome]|uniref:Unannotated protein n=1 Tax=freshwater metagenome TaxID=449393 RepID=A0A6J6ESE0_9ZZZZ
MLRFLFVPDDNFQIDEIDKAAVLDATGMAALAAGQEALGSVVTWNRVEIEAALRAKLIDEMGLKPKSAFGPVRVAVTGRRVSPPLFESLELLGQARSMARIASVLSS